MQSSIVAAFLGLVGGVVGAVVVGLVLKPGGKTTEPVQIVRASPEVMARLEQLEEQVGQDAPARLEGRPGTATIDMSTLTPEAEKALLERLAPQLDARMQEKLDEFAAKEEEGAGGRRGRKKRERLPLAEVAAQIGLSGSEEDHLRQIWADAEREMLEIFARPDGTVEDVKRDLDAFKNDRSKMPQLMSKYMPKMMSSLGDVMAVDVRKRQRVKDLVGEEKAKALGGFDIVEENPYDFGGSMRMEARAGR